MWIMSKTIVDRYDKKLMILKYLHHLVQTLKKIDNNTDGGTFGVYSYFLENWCTTYLQLLTNDLYQNTTLKSLL